MKYIIVILLMIGGLSVKGQCDTSLYVVDRDSSLLIDVAKCMRVAKYGNDPLTTFWTYLDKKQVIDGDGVKMWIYRLDIFPSENSYNKWEMPCLGNIQMMIEKRAVCEIGWITTLFK